MPGEAGPSKFRGFSPPQWIHAVSTTDLANPELASTSTSSSAYKAKESRWNTDEWDGPEVSYGPQLKRRGNLKFVKAKGLGMESEPGVDGKGKAVNRGAEVKGIYESIISASTTPEPPKKRPKAPSKPKSKSSPPKPRILDLTTVDVDLTLSSSDSESDDSDIVIEEPSPKKSTPSPSTTSSSESEDDDDDIIIINPLTSQPYPRPRKNKPRAIHQLLEDSQSDKDVPFVPPVHYGIPSNNIGWKMLQKQGWKEGEGLGPQKPEGQGDEKVIKVPIKSSNKFDKQGLGLSSYGSKHQSVLREERLERTRTEEKKQHEERGYGWRGMASVQKKEAKERKAMIAYMNR